LTWHAHCTYSCMDIVRTDLKIKRQRRRWMIGSSGGIALVALTVFLFTLDPAVPAVERESVWMDTVQRGEMLRQVRGPGVLVPKEVRWIAARTNARVERVLVKPGAVVEPDTVLVEMSNPELVQQLEEARSAVAAAEAEYAALEVQLQSQLLDQKVALAEARSEYESQRLQVEAEKELAKDNIISQLELKRSVLNAEHLKVRLEVEQERSRTFEKSLQAQLRAEQAR